MQPFADAVRSCLVAPLFAEDEREEHGSWLEGALAFLSERMDFDGGHDVGHLLRVLQNARLIAADEGTRQAVDWPAVVAAVLFHDAVNLPKDHPERSSASTRSAQLAVHWLREHAAADFDPQRLKRVEGAIRCHSFSAGLVPETIEARILSDADKLEALGAIGMARTFYVGGLLGTAIVDPFDPWAQQRPLDDLRHSVDHFFTKLLSLSERMQTDTGRRMAAARTEYMRGFLDRLADELSVALPTER